MKAPSCDTCGNGAECRQGRDCPQRPAVDVYVVRALLIYATGFWLAILGAAVTAWPK